MFVWIMHKWTPYLIPYLCMYFRHINVIILLLLVQKVSYVNLTHLHPWNDPGLAQACGSYDGYLGLFYRFMCHFLKFSQLCQKISIRYPSMGSHGWISHKRKIGLCNSEPQLRHVHCIHHHYHNIRVVCVSSKFIEFLSSRLWCHQTPMHPETLITYKVCFSHVLNSLLSFEKATNSTTLLRGS